MVTEPLPPFTPGVPDDVPPAPPLLAGTFLVFVTVQTLRAGKS
jgi:hypothetical protein